MWAVADWHHRDHILAAAMHLFPNITSIGGVHPTSLCTFIRDRAFVAITPIMFIEAGDIPTE